MRIWVDENIPQGIEAFSPFGEVTCFAGRKLSREDLKGVDALVVRSITPVNAALLQGTTIHFVGTATIGIDHVDTNYLRQADIGFASAPGCNARSVAEYVVVALLQLHLLRGIALEGKTLGIIGYGHVGKQVANIAPHLGLNVLLCDPPLALTGFPAPFASLSEIIAQSDILTLHVPLEKQGVHATFKMVNDAFFKTFESPKVLINACRGEVIDEDAVIRAVHNELLQGLILDVFPGEPKLNPNLVDIADIVTPHISGYSLQGKLNGTQQILTALHKFFNLTIVSQIHFPQPPTPKIFFQTPKKNVLEDLHHFVNQVYPIIRDDFELRHSLQQLNPSLQFDELRRNYPIRHEFAGFSTCDIPIHLTQLQSRLQGLGFLVEKPLFKKF